jgi:hypothetical protein
VCQFASRLLQVGFGQTCQAGFEVVRIHSVDVAVDLPCLCLSEGEAAITEGEGEGLFFHAVSLQGQDAGSGQMGDSPQTVTALPAFRSSHQRRSLRYPNAPHHGSAQDGDRSYHQSCNARTYPKGSHHRHSTLHMPWRYCRGIHRYRSTGRHSRFRRLPNRCTWGGCWSFALFELRLVYRVRVGSVATPCATSRAVTPCPSPA